MDANDIDKLAFALLTSIKWAVDGGKIEQLPKVHEGIVFALEFLRDDEKLSSLKIQRKRAISDVLRRNDGDIARTARELGVSRWTVRRFLNEQKESA